MLRSRRVQATLPSRLSRLAFYLGALGLAVAASPTLALSVGELQTRSSLGESLIGTIEVRIAENETFSPCCVVVAPATDATFPPLRSPQLDVQAVGERQARITVRSRERVFEPISVLRLTVGCETPLTREYVILLDPPLVTATAATVPAETPRAATTGSAAVAPAAAAPAAVASAPPPAPARRSTTPAPAPSQAATAPRAARPAPSGDRLTLGEPGRGSTNPGTAGRLAAAQAQVAEQQAQITQLEIDKRAAEERIATLETELAAREAALTQQLEQVRQQLRTMQVQIEQAQAVTAELRESSYPRSWVYGLLGALLVLSSAVVALLLRLRRQRAAETWSVTAENNDTVSTGPAEKQAALADTAGARHPSAASSKPADTAALAATADLSATPSAAVATPAPRSVTVAPAAPEPALAGQTFERLDRNVLNARIQVEELDAQTDLAQAVSLIDYEQPVAAQAASPTDSLDIDLSTSMVVNEASVPSIPAFKADVSSFETRSMAMGLDVETARECQRILSLTLSAVDDAERLMEQGKTDRAIELLRRFLSTQKETGPAPWLLLLQAARQTGQGALYEQIALEYLQALGREAPGYDDILQSILAGGLADDAVLRRSLSERWATPQFVAMVFNEVMDPSDQKSALSYPRQKELLKLASECPIDGENRPRPTVLLLG